MKNRLKTILTFMCVALLWGQVSACGAKHQAVKADAPTAEKTPQKAAADKKEPAAKPAKPALCALNIDDMSSWMPCVNKKVRLVGVKSRAHSHPIARLKGMKPGESAAQTYLGMKGGGQVVIATKAIPKCGADASKIGDTLIVTGILNRVDLGGAPGTRGGYKGWSMSGPTITCK